MRYIAPILLFALAVIAGCKKYPLAADTNLVKTLTYANGVSGFAFFTYDAQARLVTDSEDGDVFKYFYQGNRVVDSLYSGADYSLLEDIYYLNAQGLADSDMYGNHWLYNTAGEMTLLTNPQDTIIFTWSHGDQVLEQEVSGQDTITTAFTYLTTPDNRNFGQPYLGKTSYHLRATIGTLESCSYTFDALGRVSSASTADGARIISTIVYTYY